MTKSNRGPLSRRWRWRKLWFAWGRFVYTVSSLNNSVWHKQWVWETALTVINLPHAARLVIARNTADRAVSLTPEGYYHVVYCFDRVAEKDCFAICKDTGPAAVVYIHDPTIVFNVPDNASVLRFREKRK